MKYNIIVRMETIKQISIHFNEINTDILVDSRSKLRASNLSGFVKETFSNNFLISTLMVITYPFTTDRIEWGRWRDFCGCRTKAMTTWVAYFLSIAFTESYRNA